MRNIWLTTTPDKTTYLPLLKYWVRITNFDKIYLPTPPPKNYLPPIYLPTPPRGITYGKPPPDKLPIHPLKKMQKNSPKNSPTVQWSNGPVHIYVQRLVTRTSRNNDKLLYKLNKRRPRIEMMDVEMTSVCYFWVPILFRLFDITCQ